VAGSQQAECGPPPALQAADAGLSCCAFLHCNIVFCRHTGGAVAGSQHAKHRPASALQAARPSQLRRCTAMPSCRHTGGPVVASVRARTCTAGSSSKPKLLCPFCTAILHCRHTGGAVAGSQHAKYGPPPALQAADSRPTLLLFPSCTSCILALQAADPSLSYCAISTLQCRLAGTLVAQWQAASRPAPALQAAHPGLSLSALHCRPAGTLAAQWQAASRPAPALQAAHPGLTCYSVAALQYCPAGTVAAQWQAA
jgi:hypothetical protein